MSSKGEETSIDCLSGQRLVDACIRVAIGNAKYRFVLVALASTCFWLNSFS